MNIESKWNPVINLIDELLKVIDSGLGVNAAKSQAPTTTAELEEQRNVLSAPVMFSAATNVPNAGDVPGGIRSRPK